MSGLGGRLLRTFPAVRFVRHVGQIVRSRHSSAGLREVRVASVKRARRYGACRVCSRRRSGGPPRQIVCRRRSGRVGRVPGWWEGMHLCRFPFWESTTRSTASFRGRPWRVLEHLSVHSRAVLQRCVHLIGSHDMEWSSLVNARRRRRTRCLRDRPGHPNQSPRHAIE